jgi:hypothetical protein
VTRREINFFGATLTDISDVGTTLGKPATQRRAQLLACQSNIESNNDTRRLQVRGERSANTIGNVSI